MMDIIQFAPKVFRNIYENLQKCDDGEKREESIQKIAKDVFRILLILPMAPVLSLPISSSLTLPAFVVCGLISPPALILSVATLSTYLGPVLLVKAIATNSFEILGISLLYGLVAYQGYEYYEETPHADSDFFYHLHQINLENYLMKPLLNRVAKAFV